MSLKTPAEIYSLAPSRIQQAIAVAKTFVATFDSSPIVFIRELCCN